MGNSFLTRLRGFRRRQAKAAAGPFDDRVVASTEHSSAGEAPGSDRGSKDAELNRKDELSRPAQYAPGMPKIIYDVGSNNGDDLPYYLQKADIVVAVEADPALAGQIAHRFSSEVANGRLRLENCVATVNSGGGYVPFYIHRGHHVLSQFDRPVETDIQMFNEVNLPSKRLVDLISNYGAPYYIKIDVEGYDYRLLMDLFANTIFPPYISAESHSVDVFAALVAAGGYKALKLVDGPSIQEVYRDHTIRTDRGDLKYSFPDHSAGPFGEDVLGVWESPNSFLHTLARAGLGWKDIHASRSDTPAY